MSDIFAMSDPSADDKLAEAKANSVDSLSEIDAPWYRGTLKGVRSGAMRGFAKIADTLGITAGGTVGQPIDRSRELLDTGQAAARSSGDILSAILSGNPMALSGGVPAPVDSIHTEAQDAIFNKTEDVAGSAVDYWTPRANEVGRLGQILGGLGEAGAQLVAGGGSPIPLVAASTLEGGKELVKQGVDAGTAGAAGALEGAANYAGLKIPFVGDTLLSRVASGAAGNVALGAGERKAEKSLLESQGYTEQAKPFESDLASVSLDALLGALFGVTHHTLAPRVRPELTPAQSDAILAARNAKSFQESGPGTPEDLRAHVASQDAAETVLEQLSRGEPANVGDVVARNEGAGFQDAAKVDEAAQTAKQFLKDHIDTRPLPDIEDLSKEPADYLQETETSARVPLDRVDLSKTGTEASGDNAVKRFAAAAAGEIPKRAPVSLEVDENGRYRVVDGNGTVTALKRMGLDQMIAEVNPSRSLLDAIDQATDSSKLRASLREAYANAARVKPVYDSAVREIAKEVGTTHEPLIPDALKDVKRAVEKVNEDYGGDAAKLKDLVRSTVVIDNYDQAQAAIDSAVKRFGQPTKFRNTLDQDVATPDGYRDVNLNFTLNGHTVEMQVTLPELARAKTEMHKLYEERRKLASRSDAQAIARINELNDQMRARYAAAFDEALSRLNSDSSISTPPSSKGKLSVTGRPSGTSNAETVTPPSGVGSADTGTPLTFQKTGSLPNTGRATSVSSGGIVPQPAGGGPDISRENSQASQEAATRQVVTATGRRIEVRPRVVELADVVTSDSAKFPQELQPRQRGARKELENQVRDIANNLDPQRLDDSAEADRGAPITGEGNVVESGNGRVMALKYAYENLPEKAKAYRDYLEAQGYDTSGMKQPVLIRERVTPLDMSGRRAFTVEANQAATAALSPVERAQADARILDANVLSRMRGGEIASVQNANFVRGFLERVPQAERNALVNTDGSVSQEGVRRIQAALLAKAYGGTPESSMTLGRMLESTDSDMRTALGAMLDAAPAFARLRQAIAEGKVSPEYDVSKFLTQAVENVARLRASGHSLADFLAQHDMLNERPPIVDELMRSFYDRTGSRIQGREKIAGALMRYASQALKQRLDQASLFAEEPVAPEKLVANSLETQVPEVAALDNLVLTQGDRPVITGYDAEGNPIKSTVAEQAAQIREEYARDINDTKAYEAAVGCFLGHGA